MPNKPEAPTPLASSAKQQSRKFRSHGSLPSSFRQEIYRLRPDMLAIAIIGASASVLVAVATFFTALVALQSARNVAKSLAMQIDESARREREQKKTEEREEMRFMVTREVGALESRLRKIATERRPPE